MLFRERFFLMCHSSIAEFIHRIDSVKHITPASESEFRLKRVEHTRQFGIVVQ